MHTRTFSLALCLGLLAGCTTTVYQGSIKAPDAGNTQRQVVLYWTKTEPWVGDAKADIAHLLTECGSLVVFENTGQGIVFRGEPGRDIPVSGQANSPNTFECGRFVDAKDLKAVTTGPVALTIQCNPVSDDFSVTPRQYLKASSQPYEFNITADEQWSMLGTTPTVPKPPACVQAR